MGVILRALAASKYVLLALLVAVLLLVVVSTTSSRTEAQDQGSRQAVGESRGANVVSSEISAKKQADAKEYWTPERMRNAKPLDMTLPGSPESSGANVAQPQGRPVMIPGSPPGGGSTTGASATTTSIAPKATTSNGYTYPFPFTRYEVIDPGSTSYEAYPYRTNGKVFFKRGKENRVCSGTVVTTRNSSGPGNRSLIWTAGHCVSDGKGNFHTNWVFVPAYRDNVEPPFGTWTSRQPATKAGWHNSSNREMDLGAVVVNTDFGKRLEERVGSQGIWFNKPYPQHWTAFGYPGEPPFNGQRLIACSASYATQGNPSTRTNVPTIGIGCDMTEGSSGGGWIERWSFGGGFVNSVTSYRPKDQPLAVYGPYHGQAALDLYNHARTL